jgi:predicted porin
MPGKDPNSSPAIATMTLTRLTAAVLALLSHHAFAQDGAVQIYGRLNIGLEAMRGDGARRGQAVQRLSNYRSVLGLRGSEDLGGGLKLVFQVESTLAPDTGAGAIAARDTRIGLQGRWGSLFGGNWPTPYNTATSGLDPFYPTTAGYMSIMGNGSAPSASNVSDTTSFDRRQQNSLHYWTPAWQGMTLRLAHGFNEEMPPSGARPSLDAAALVLEHGPLYAALAHERHHDYQGPGLDDHGSKVALAWQFGPQLGQVRVAAVAEKLRYATARGDLVRVAYYLALTRQFGAHGIRFGLARAGEGKGSAGTRLGFIQAGPDTGATHATLGYDYTLSKRTALFAFYTRLRNDGRGAYDFAINGLDASPGAHLSGAALGIRHSF